MEDPSQHHWLGDKRTDTPLTLAAWAAAAIDSEYALQSSPPVQWRAGRPILFAGLGAGRDDEAALWGALGAKRPWALTECALGRGSPGRGSPGRGSPGRGTRAARGAIKSSGSNSTWAVPSLKGRFHSSPPQAIASALSDIAAVLGEQAPPLDNQYRFASA
ncbi:MAG: hypothetical protein GKR94_20235 [Gammaproteobacteria bacterium]|nr:hypothetical protein [Gammaproteobacteria bacterium]